MNLSLSTAFTESHRFGRFSFLFVSMHIWFLFWTVVLEKTLESPLDCKEIKSVHSKGDQSWVFIGRNDAKAETPILWPPHAKSWLIRKDSDAGNDRGQEKGTTEDEMAGWHHQLDGHEFEWTLGVGDGQGGLACCNSWGCKESDMTGLLNWTEQKKKKNIKNTNIWRLKTHFWITNKSQKRNQICIETNKNENLPNLWDSVKAVLRERFIAIQAYIEKQERNQINNVTLYLKQPEKEEMKNPRVSRRKEIIKIRA